MGSHASARAVIVGGSLGGLTAALLLRDLGWDVHVLERSPRPLMARGVGIVAHPASTRYLVERCGTDLQTMTATSRFVRYVDGRGAVVDEADFEYRFTSFFALYRELIGAFDRDRYQLAHEVAGFRQTAGGVEVETIDGARRECDLLVFADGIHSTGRRLLLPQARREYAGYVAWRGVVNESDLPRETFALLQESIIYSLLPSSHILSYPIPNTDGSIEPGRRLINWIWYRNLPAGPGLDALLTDRRGRTHDISLPPGGVREEHLDALHRSADELLAPQLAEMVRNSREPFVQVVFDVEVERLAFERACLIGDAATVLRPHVAVGTAKAAQAAWNLAAAIEASGDDVAAALRAWEPGQLELEHSVLARTRDAGERVQVHNSWRVGDPLPFGLYVEGDSAMPRVTP